VRDFFGICGTVTACRLCGDTEHPARFGFIEFATKESAQAAMQLTGVAFGSFPIRVAPSLTPVLPDTKRKVVPNVSNSQMKQVEDTLERINRRLQAKGKSIVTVNDLLLLIAF